jgi:hypothetical protein
MMARDFESGYVCCLRVNKTNIYKFSYTKNTPEERIGQIKNENSDLNLKEIYIIEVRDLAAARIYFKTKLKKFEYTKYGERENFYKFPESITTQDVINCMKQYGKPNTSHTQSIESDTSGWGVLIFVGVIVLAFLALHPDDKHQKCVNNGGGNACENIKQE